MWKLQKLCLLNADPLLVMSDGLYCIAVLCHMPAIYVLQLWKNFFWCLDWKSKALLYENQVLSLPSFEHSIYRCPAFNKIICCNLKPVWLSQYVTRLHGLDHLGFESQQDIGNLLQKSPCTYYSSYWILGGVLSPGENGRSKRLTSHICTFWGKHPLLTSIFQCQCNCCQLSFF